MTKLLLALSFFVFSFSHAQDWKFILEANNATFYYKPNTKNTAWVKEISETTEYFTSKNPATPKLTDGYTMTLWKFDCDNKKIAPIQINVYSQKGNLLQNVENDEYSIKMIYVTPDSLGENFFTEFCNKEK